MKQELEFFKGLFYGSIMSIILWVVVYWLSIGVNSINIMGG